METQHIKTDKVLQFFTDFMPVAEEKFVKNKVVIAQENMEARGSKEYSNSFSLIAESVEAKFGTAKTFVANSRGGKYDDNTKYTNIQDQLVGNYYNLDT